MTPFRRAERYVVGQGTEGAVISLRQNREALNFAAAAGVMLIGTWWFGPAGPNPSPKLEGWFYWVWLSLLATCVVIGGFGALYRQSWVITDGEIIITDTFRLARHVIPRPAPMRLHLDASGAAVGGVALAYEVTVEDQIGQAVLPPFLFATQRGAEDFVEVLRLLLHVDVDLPKRHGPVRDVPDYRR